jgi:hypothetical protein
LSTIVASNSDVKPPKGSPPKSKEEKEADKAATKIREDVKKKMRRFISRLPAFMYLTDKREMSIRDLILHGESEMFERVSGLTVDIFRQLVDAKAFNDSKMDAAVMMFRRFEESSLSYNDQLVMILTDDQPHTGGW